MKESISIKLKAILLLIVFSMNSIISFACAVRVNMAFNDKHHVEEITENPVHIHAEGNENKHHNHANHDKNKSSEKGGCCNDKIVKFQNLEKNITAKTMIKVPLFVAIVSTFPGIDLYNITKRYPQKIVVRFYYPPPSDILISIQKFQV